MAIGTVPTVPTVPVVSAVNNRDKMLYNNSLALLSVLVKTGQSAVPYLHLIDKNLEEAASKIADHPGITATMVKTLTNIDLVADNIVDEAFLPDIIDNLEKINRQNLLGKIVSEVNQFSEDPKKELDKIGEMLSEEANSDNKEIDLTDFDSVLPLIKSNPPPPVSTGIKELDALWQNDENPIGGYLSAEEFMVIKGRTGEGKTFVLIKFLTSAFLAGKNVMVYSPELSEELMVQRLLVDFFKIPKKELKAMPEQQLRTLYTNFFKGRKNALKVQYLARGKTSVQDIKRVARKHKLDVILIDGLSYLLNTDSKWQDYKQYEVLGSELKNLATEEKCAVIGAVQNNRSGNTTKSGNIFGGDGLAFAMTSCLDISTTSILPDGRRVVRIYADKMRNSRDRVALYFNWSYKGNTYEFTQAVNVRIENGTVDETDVIENWGGLSVSDI